MKMCFVCKNTKSIDDFYAHPRMADGHLNKCKECCKSQAGKRRVYLEHNDIEWRERELLRHRIKSENYRKEKRYSHIKQSNREDYTSIRVRARKLISSKIRDGKILPLPCLICGKKAEAHHEDYTKPLDVIWLCKRHHMDRHIEINKMLRFNSFIEGKNSSNEKESGIPSKEIFD